MKSNILSQIEKSIELLLKDSLNGDIYEDGLNASEYHGKRDRVIRWKSRERTID